MKQIDFKKLTPSKVIRAMVRGLKKKYVKIDMGTFGSTSWNDKVCYGCAATNALCELAGKKIPVASIQSTGSRATFLKVADSTLTKFELAINSLRQGDIYGANEYLLQLGIDPIENPKDIRLPYLNNRYVAEDLRPYEVLARTQRT